MARGRFVLGSVVWGLAGGCGATSGTAVPVAARGAAPVVAEVTTYQRDGLRVLWNGPVRRGAIEEERRFSAGNQGELDALWETVGMLGPAPPVDFAREVGTSAAARGQWLAERRARRRLGLPVISKPTTPTEVLLKIRQVLDASWTKG